MRIDASNLLLAAQVHTQHPAAAKAQPQPQFEAMDFAKSAGPEERKPQPFPGALARPGSQLDIKV